MISSPFESFWMAGYECADHLNKYGDRVDLLSASGHLSCLTTDYDLLTTFHIKTVREGIRWSIVERRPYQYIWDEVVYMMRQAASSGVQQIWDLCHFGFPDDLTPLHPEFADRFEALCVAFVKLFRSVSPYSPILVTPINEVSFLSWLGGEAACTSPFCINQGWEVKYQLIKAYIRGITAMKALDNNVIIISTEPLIHVAAPAEACEEQRQNAALKRNAQFQATDMLCGLMCPELGGHSDCIDIIGVNFYYSNQWIYSTDQMLSWADHDRHADWKPLSSLLTEVYQRYKKPLVISETSHPGEDRGMWFDYVAHECRKTIEQKIPLYGVCLYPVIDRPDWDDITVWHHSGLWGVTQDNPHPSQRIIFPPLADAILSAQHALSMLNRQPGPIMA